MEEIWKDIPNYEGLYQASTLGRIRTCEGKTTFTAKHGIRHWKQRQLKPFWFTGGYMVNLWKNGKRKPFLVARLVATTFLENLIDTEMTVNHINGNRRDNYLENLEWVTRGENVRLAFDTGLYSTAHKCELISNDKTLSFKSQSEASRYLGKCHTYIHGCIKKGYKAKGLDGTVYTIRSN